MALPTRNLRHMDKQDAIKIAIANEHVLQDAPGKSVHGTKWRCIRCNEEATYAGGELIESLLEEPCNGAPLLRDAIPEALPVPNVPATPAAEPVPEVTENPDLPDESVPVKARARKPAVPEL